MDLEIEGMTCASCAVRIEKSLNRLDGVHASVNYAAESAVGALRSEARLGRAARRRGAERRVHGQARRGRARRRNGYRSSPARRFRRADGSARADRDGAPAPVPRLGVGGARARGTGGALGRLAVPPGRVPEPAPRLGDHGHPGLDRHARGAPLVDRRSRRPRRRPPLLRGRRRHHDADPARALPRVARTSPLRRGDPLPGRARREGGERRCATGSRSPFRSASSRSASCSSSGPARSSRATASSSRGSRRSTSRC